MPGVIIGVKELVVKVQFDDNPPELNELLEVLNDNKTKLLVEHFEDNQIAYCLNLNSDLSLKTGQQVEGTSQTIEIPVGDQIIGRVLDTFGQPLDGLEPVRDNVPKKSIHDYAKKSDQYKIAKPQIMETGIKVIDFFTPFVKGRKIGIIGGAGVGKTVLTMELINNTSKSSSSLSIFSGMGERIREGHELWLTLKENDLLKNSALFFAQTNENPIQRSLIGLTAATAAEYFRDNDKKDVLFFADNMYRYVQARNELSTVLEQVPNEGGYGATFFSDVKTLQDRLSSNENGSITSVQTIYVPADDITDPAVQMIQHEMDSIIVLSRKVAEQGIRPAVDLNSTSSSLLTPEIVGDRHYLLSIQVQALLKKYESLRSIIAIIGESELSPSDRADYNKAKRLITNFAQNLNVMNKLTGVKGEYFSLEETLKSIEEIIV